MCEIPGAFTLAMYSYFLVMGCGSLTLGYIIVSFLYKVIHVIALQICPMCIVAAKKKHHDIPRDFSHYSNEFDFECD